MADQMDGPVRGGGGGGVDHGGEVLDEPLEPVGLGAGRGGRRPRPPHVVGHDVVAGGEPLGHGQPHGACVGVPVDEDDRGAVGVAVAPLADGEIGAAVGELLDIPEASEVVGPGYPTQFRHRRGL